MSLEPAPEPIGPGAMVLVVGPSGAGKDTILRHARASLAEQSRIRFPPRVVTRAADAAEDNDSMSEAEFECRRKAGYFLMVWRAHGLSYGIPMQVAAWLRAGDVVVVNVSRTVIAMARRILGTALVVLVTAPHATRAARLAARGRDADVEQRLSRDPGAASDLKPDLVIDNGGSLDAATQRLCGFLLSLSSLPG